MEYIQEVTARVQAAKLGDARTLYDALEAHRRELQGQRGFLSMRIGRSSEAGGDTLVSVETRWSSREALAGYESGARNAQIILNEYGDLLTDAGVTSREMEAVDTVAESPSRVIYERFLFAGLVPVVIIGLGLAIIYAVSRIYLEMGSDGATPLAIIISSGILLVAWYFAEQPKAPNWQFVAVGTFVVAALVGGTITAAVIPGPEVESGGEAVASPTPSAPGELRVELDDNVVKFGGQNDPTIRVGANVPVLIQVSNVGTALHNLHIANPSFGDAICSTGGANPCTDPARIAAKGSGTLTFTLPPGKYDYRCDFHPTEMKGTLEVVEGGPTGQPQPGGPGWPGGPGGGGTPAPGGPGGNIALTLEDNKFVENGQDNPTITAPANTDVTIDLSNEGDALHNMHIANPDFEAAFCAANGSNPCSNPVRIPAGSKATIKFNLPPGTYDYRCDFHANEMKGTIRVQ